MENIAECPLIQLDEGADEEPNLHRGTWNNKSQALLCSATASHSK